MSMLALKRNLGWKLTSIDRAKNKYLSKIRPGFVDICGQYKVLDNKKGRICEQNSVLKCFNLVGYSNITRYPLQTIPY